MFENDIVVASFLAQKKQLIEPPETKFVVLDSLFLDFPWTPRGQKTECLTIQSLVTGNKYTTEAYNLEKFTPTPPPPPSPSKPAEKWMNFIH